MILLTMLMIPILVDLGFLIAGGSKFSIKKFLLDIGVQTILMAVIAYAISCQNTSDTEVWNGKITSKAREEVSCEHSYSCHCYTSCSGSGSSRSCSTYCQTCYEHSYDVDWAVYTSLKNRFTIGRVSRQGITEPARWDAVEIGEPYSRTSEYTNYVKGSPDTLFRHQGLTAKFKDVLPEYPKNIYDYYHLDRLVTVGTVLADVAMWNKDLMQLNADLGSSKQVNAVVVITKDQPEDYFYALEQQWIGGKKNDVVLVINVDSSGKISWVNSMAWTDNKIFQVALRDSILQVGSLDREKIVASLRTNINQNFVRKPMKDFQYLSRLIKPTTGQWIFSMVFGLALSVGMGILLLKNDVFNEEVTSYRRRV